MNFTTDETYPGLFEVYVRGTEYAGMIDEEADGFWAAVDANTDEEADGFDTFTEALNWLLSVSR